MPQEQKVILVGGFHEIIELLQLLPYTPMGIIDPQLEGTYMGLEILGDDSRAKEVSAQHPDTGLIITPDLPEVRAKLVDTYRPLPHTFPTLQHPTAEVSASAQIEVGTIIQSHAIVSSCTTIGEFCKLNVRATVMHDSKIGSFVTIAPGAMILGEVTIGKCSYIGAHATILPGMKIGEGVTVGAGAVVTKDILDGDTVAGVPAASMRT